jgi:hypothetical protein
VTNLREWTEAGERNHWGLPTKAGLILRLPIIRHVRAAWCAFQVERHYTAIAGLGLLRTGYDEWVVYAIWKGLC